MGFLLPSVKQDLPSTGQEPSNLKFGQSERSLTEWPFI